ncbi:MAG TPA: asparagine synthase-related protein [Polyangiaceae bacterium]|nr:asparagine synthase-related protein [Polyangiaceae bacterium]
MLDSSRAAHSEGGAHLATWAPARLERHEISAVAYAVPRAGGRPPQGHASARIEAGALTLEAPALLEYPLYYARAPDDAYLLACSRLEPLARIFPDAPLAATRLLSFFAPGVRDPDAGTTVYAGIRRLVAGQRVTAAGRAITTERSTPRLGGSYLAGTPTELAAELARLLEAAVGRAIAPAKRVAVFASGGLDSSGVLAFAARRRADEAEREVLALSVRCAAPCDDRPYFEELIGSLPVTPVRLSPREAGAAWFRRSLCADGQPLQFASGVLDLMLGAAAVARGAEVTLHGGGGDPMLGGPLPFAQLARRGHAVAALRGAWRLRVPWSSTRWGRLRSLVLSPLVPRALVRIRRRRGTHAPWMTARSRAVADWCMESADSAPWPPPDTPDAWMQSLCDDETRYDSADAGAQVLSLTGCASADALMDPEFVRFMLQIDPVLLSYGDEYKGLYRLAMQGVLPERVRTRQDKGCVEPAIAAAALGADALGMLGDLASLRALVSRGLVDPLPLRPILDAWLAAVRRGERSEPDAADEHWQPLWQLLSVEAFLREHGPGRALA